MAVSRRMTVKHAFLIALATAIESCDSFAVTETKIRRHAAGVPFGRSDASTLTAAMSFDDTAYTETNQLQAKNHDDKTPRTIRQTPCNRICRYNSDFYDGAVCIGCFREAFEIGNWARFTAAERLYALQDALDRCNSLENGESGDHQFEGSVSPQELEDMIAFYRGQK